MSEQKLTLRDLNRAILARQMLLERQDLTAPAALERLAGAQAQASMAPYVGLWARLRGFQREDLAQPIENRQVVKATWVRATLHLVTAEDYVRFRTTLQPVLSQASSDIAQQRGADFDTQAVLAAAREFIGEQPRSFSELSELLAQRWPNLDVSAMRYMVRTHLPLVQAPVAAGWSFPGNPKFTLAEPWIGREIDPQAYLRELVLRYLAAFGPASAADMQTWSGLVQLKETFEELRPELVTYRDEKRRELFDLPCQPLPGADVPAPVRFLPEYDNLLRSHSSRTRVLADEYRSRVFLPALRVASTILVDGFVRGVWKIEKTKKTAVLEIEPFELLSAPDRSALLDEAEKLVRFAEPGAASYEVRFAVAG